MEEGYLYNSNVRDGDPENNDYILPPQSARFLSKTFSKNLPKQFSRRDQTPEVLDQGTLPSCVGFATTLVLEDSLQYRGMNLSPMWVYKKSKNYEEWEDNYYEGTSISAACKALKKEGVCVEELWPYSSSEDTYPLGAAYVDAPTRKIHSYYKILPQQVNTIKEVLQNQSLICSIVVNDNFINTKRDGFVQNYNYFETERSFGHALALIGWKEIDGNLFWEFQNSWGVDYGDNGYCFIKADLFSQICMGGVYFLVTNKEVGYSIKYEYLLKKPKRYTWYEKLCNGFINFFNQVKYRIFKKLKSKVSRRS